MSLNNIIASFILVLTTSIVSGQLLVDKVIPPSPNAAAVIKYCDHPIKRSTGIHKIKIPIHTINYNKIYVPISLNYHTIGIKAEEEASWTGLGWYLQAGGMITRMVRGKNDLSIAEQELGTNAIGYPFETIKPCLDDCEEAHQEDFRQKVCNGEIDTDPDIFFFDILGKRGKFMLTPGHDKNKDTLQINLVSPTKMTAVFYLKENKWVIKDRRDYTYTFKTREITEAHRNYFDYKFQSHKVLFKYYADLATTAWYLDEIKNKEGDRVTFIYDMKPDGHSRYGSNGAHNRMNINDEDVWDVHYTSYCFPDSIENVQILSEAIHGDVYLKSIRYGGKQIELLKSEREDIVIPSSLSGERLSGSQFTQYLTAELPPQKLDVLEVLDVGKLAKKVQFHYSYFNGDESGPKARLYKRLRLDSVSVSNKKGAYKFSYQEEFGLPSKESHSRDLWGYFNGEEDPHNITPSDFFNYNQQENVFQKKNQTRHYSLKHAMEGMLVKKISPAGGIEEYIYDSQEYTAISHDIDTYYDEKMIKTNFDHNVDPFIAGGLRLKDIVYHYPVDKIYKEFVYVKKDGSEGILSVTPFSHSHNNYGHKTSGNHHVVYDKVEMKTGKVYKGQRF